MKSNFPAYVRIDSKYGCALKLIKADGHRAYYWRHGGMWGVWATYESGELKTPIDSSPAIIGGLRLKKILKKEWVEDNGSYAHVDYGPPSE
jgi:hypothetical protein